MGLEETLKVTFFKSLADFLMKNLEVYKTRKKKRTRKVSEDNNTMEQYQN